MGVLAVAVVGSGCRSSQEKSYEKWSRNVDAGKIEIDKSNARVDSQSMRSDMRTRAQLLEDAYKRGAQDALAARNKTVMNHGYPYGYWKAPIRQTMRVPHWELDPEASLMFPPHERDVVAQYGSLSNDVNTGTMYSDHMMNVDQVWERPQADYETWAREGQIRPMYEKPRKDEKAKANFESFSSEDMSKSESRRYSEVD